MTKHYSPQTREKRRGYCALYIKKQRKRVIAAYGGQCACCGESELAFLAIDHIHGGGNRHRREIGSQNIYPWLEKRGYPEGFRVLCHNCNLGRAFNKDICPHHRPQGNVVMIVKPLEYSITADDFSEATVARSPGLHLSSIIADLNAVRGCSYPESDESTKQLRFAMGFIWERIIAQYVPETAMKRAQGQLVRPGEFRLEGITMTPDALDLTDYSVEEYKATWLSSNNELDSPKFWHWFVQIKCYCKALATSTARLRVFFVNGDWAGSGPQMKAWNLSFDQRETEEAWSMVKNHAKAKGWL